MKKTIIVTITISLFFLTASAGWSARKSGVEVKKSTGSKHMKIKLGEDEVDIEKVRMSRKWLEIKKEKVKEMLDGTYYDKHIRVTVFETPNSGYIGKSKTMRVEGSEGRIRQDDIFTLYTLDGRQVFKKFFKWKDVVSAAVLKSGYSLLKIDEMKGIYNFIDKWGVYSNRGELLYELKDVTQFSVSPQADYILILQKKEDGKVVLKKLGLEGEIEILKKFKGLKRIRGFCEKGECFVVMGGRNSQKLAPCGNYYGISEVYFFKNDKLKWYKEINSSDFKAESSWGWHISKTGQYLIWLYKIKMKCAKHEENGKIYRRWWGGIQRFYVLDTKTREIVYDGPRDDALIKQYREETINKEGERGLR